ncbi:hypothetical protein LRY60_05895 [Candidatus Woesebacteria bacterium]|nr:hypothetical protein [Candidatus Woesebacteria bacterium]
MQLQHIQIALFPEQPFAPQWTLLNTQLNEHFQLSGNTQLLSIENLPADFPRITAENDDMAFIFSAEKLSVYWKARENTLPGGILEDLRTILDILRQLAPEARYWRMGYIAAFSYATPNPHEFIFEHFYGDTVRDVEGFSRESDMATVTFRRSYEELQNVDINTFF